MAETATPYDFDVNEAQADMATLPEVFIIESLKFEDEDANMTEGEILAGMLRLIGKCKTQYFYIRTEKELDEIIDKFDDSAFRYLHFSCHADLTGMATTLDFVSYEALGEKLKSCLLGRRVFVSGCQMASPRLAAAILKGTGCTSLLGPKDKINFDDSAAFWLMFYHLMFKADAKKMKHSEIEYFSSEMSRLIEESFSYFRTDADNSDGYRKIALNSATK